MLLKCSCGKIFRVKGESTGIPEDCPACGGVLRPVQASTPQEDPPAGDPRSHLKAITDILLSYQGALAERDAELADARGKIDAAREAFQAQQSHHSQVMHDLRDELATTYETFERQIQALNTQVAEARSEADRRARLEVELSTRLENAEQAQQASLLRVEDLLAEQSRSLRELDELRAALAASCETSSRRIQALNSELAETREDADRGVRVEAELSRRLEEAQDIDKRSLSRIADLEQKLEDERRSLATLEGKATSAERERDSERREKEGIQLRLSEALHRVEHLEQELQAAVLAASLLQKMEGTSKDEDAKGNGAPGDATSRPSLSLWYWVCPRCSRWNSPSTQHCMSCSASRLARSG
jgi:chromosome segregation ATPase